MLGAVAAGAGRRRPHERGPLHRGGGRIVLDVSHGSHRRRPPSIEEVAPQLMEGFDE
jgi:hypothetical protein